MDAACTIHLVGGEKVRVAGTLEDVAKQLGTTAIGPDGFNRVTAHDKTILINRELVTYVQVHGRTGTAQFS